MGELLVQDGEDSRWGGCWLLVLFFVVVVVLVFVLVLERHQFR
jgi:hypothetical protein